MPNVNFTLTGDYVKVKDSGVIATMRLSGAIAHLVESSAKPDTDAAMFPMRSTDQPFTFSSNSEVWAKGSGTLHVINVTPE